MAGYSSATLPVLNSWTCAGVHKNIITNCFIYEVTFANIYKEIIIPNREEYEVYSHNSSNSNCF
jgi:hypothetical protein